MSSKQDIINFALTFLEEKTTIDASNTLAGTTLELFYDTVYQSMLKRNPYGWTFARTIVSLGQVVNTPTLDNYENVFALPSDYLMMIRLDGSTNTFVVVGTLLYSNDDSVKIVYISNVSEPLVSPEFATAVAYELAMRVAGKITGKQEIKQDLFYKARESLGHAIGLDIAQMDTQQYLPININYNAHFQSGFPFGSYSGGGTYSGGGN